MKFSKSDNTYFNITKEQNTLKIVPLEPLIFSNAGQYRPLLKELKNYAEAEKIVIDFSHQTKFDTYLVVFYDMLKSYSHKTNIEFDTVLASDEVVSILNLLKTPASQISVPPNTKTAIYNYLEITGNITLNVLKESYNLISFFGELFQKFVTLIFHPSRMRWKDLPVHFTQSGVMALPITIMIVFLLGLITGYQGSVQLKQFGADMFLANLIGISLTRELAPLMVAILVAGRSGAAFAAELGTMKVSEEIDALTTMGYDKFEFLVLPRVMSVALAMPFLVIICDVIGIFGGLLAGLSVLDITTAGYIARLQMAVDLGDVISGLVKSVAFGFLIASLGCYKGLTVQGGADAVGRYTTSSVVAGVFVIILADAVFTFIFQSLGI